MALFEFVISTSKISMKQNQDSFAFYKYNYRSLHWLSNSNTIM